MSKPAKLLKRLIATGNLGGSGFALDRLEDRLLMSTVTWTGNGGDNKWTTGANWDTSSAPQAGDDLVFASGAAQSSAVNDFSSGTHFNSISFTGSGYTVSGNDIFLQAGMTQSVAGTNTYSGRLFLLNDGQSFSVATGGTLVLSNTVSSFGLSDVNKTGAGKLTLQGSDDIDAEVNVSAGTLEVDGSIPTQVILTGSGSVTGSGVVGGISATGGSVATGSATLLSSSDVSLAAGSTFSAAISGLNTHGELDVSGAVSLGSALSLSSSFSANIGDSFTLISNEGNDPIIGTFTGLAQGTTLTANGQRFQISYTGGDGNDVTLTRVQDTSSVTLGSSGATVVGQSVTFTATVTGGAPGAAAPTGTVQFYDNGVVLGNAVTLDGSGVATLSTSGLTRATHAITAVYSATDAFAGSTSNSVSQVVSKSPSSVNVVQSAGTTVWGQDATFTATVAASGPGSGTPTGQVRFLDGVTTLGTVTLVNGQASLDLSTLAVGSRTITVIYAGSGDFNSSSNNVGVLHTVNQDSTTPTVTSSSQTSTYLDSVTFTATVPADAPGAGTPTGTVTFFDGVTNLGSRTLSSGSASLTISSLAGGTHDITAVYAGDSNFAGNTSAIMTQTVNAAATITALDSSNTSSTFGDSLTFTATVTSLAGTVNTGTVSFYEGQTLLGTGNVDGSGVATYSTAALGAGEHDITASYGATTNFATSTNAEAVQQNIAKANTAAVVISSNGSTNYGASVTFTATVTSTGGTPTGTVTFYDGETILGTDTLDNNGQATATLSTLDAGTHSITAVYGADDNFNGQTSQAIDQVVIIAPTGTAISTTGSPTTYGGNVTFTATVTSPAGTPAGDVAFYDGGTLLNTVTLDGSGVATLTLGSLGAGSHQIYADFLGSTDYDVSNDTLVQGVTKANSSTAGAVSTSTSTYGQSVTFTATVTSTGGTPTGDVEFDNGGDVLGTVAVDENGVATLTLASLDAGSYAVTAGYLGDSNFNTSGTVGSQALTVSQASTSGELGLSTSNSNYGDQVTLTATFSSDDATPTGQVSFYDDVALLGTQNLDSNGQATLDVSLLGAGTHDHLHVVLASSTDFDTSTSPDQTLDINTATSGITLTNSGNSNYTNQVTFTATVTGPGATPTGNVAFFDNNNVFLATVALDGNGQAVFQTTDLTGGDHGVTALYEGDTNYNSQPSDASNMNVSPITATVGDSLSSSTITHGDTLTVTASVTYTNRAPSGTVELLDGDTVLDTQTLDNNGGATLTTSALGAGIHTLTIAYQGDDNFIASGHDDSVTVNQASTTTTVGVSGSSTSYLTNAEFTATVTSGGGTPTGTVTFFAWGNAIGGPVSLDNNGVATLDYADLPAGTYSITAVYTGDDNFSSSSDLVGGSHTVTQPATSVAAPTVPAHGTFGSSIDLTATVTSVAGTPTGTIEFFDGVTDLGSATVDGDGTATLTTSSLSLGDHSITAEYNGNSNYAVSSTSGSSSVHIQSATITTISSSHQTSVHGQSVNITVTVVGTANGASVPTGNVAIFDGDTFLQTSAVDASGQMTFTSSSLSTGSHDITAEYVGDNDSVSSDSSDFTQTVNRAATTTVATVSSPVTVHGQSVNLIATISTTAPGEGVAAGTVQFFVDGTAIGNAQAVNGSGVATLATTALTTANHTITAVYSGNTDFTGSSDNTGTGEFVTKDNAAISITSSGSTVWGQQVTFTATMTSTAPGSGTPTGTVVFVDGSTPISQAIALVNGSVSINLSNLIVADHRITVVYSGDDDFTGGSPHSGITQSVTQSPVTATLSSSSATSVYGEHFTLTAGVTAGSPGAGSPTGTVTFKSDGNAIGGPVALVDGAATLDVSSLAVAGHTLTVVYNGDGNFLTGTSSGVSHTVNRASADTTVTLSSNTSTFHQNVTLTATLATEAPGAGTGTGTVTFMDGQTSLGSATLNNGVATLDIATLSVGDHQIVAVYSGDSSFAGSIANGATETVSKATTSTGVISSGDSTFGGSVTFTATVASTAGTPTGTVTFMDGATSLGQGTLTNGVATLTTSALLAGSHSITVSYDGDGSYLISGPASVTQNVAKASASASVSSPGSIVYGSGVTLTATVTSTAGTPTGTVTFMDGDVTLGTGTLINGVATASVPLFTAGTHTVTAVYSGDSNFNGTTSNGYTQSVSRGFTDSATTTVQSTSTYGDSVTITTTITGVSTPTGTVTFYDGATMIGTGTLDENGVATLTTTTLAAGVHDFTGSYGGDGNFVPALSSDGGPLTVGQAQPGVSVTSSGAITYGNGITVTATVTGTATTPTGTVTFMDGDEMVDTVGVGQDGTASLELDGLVGGDHNITAIYSGDDNYTENQSDGYTQTVNTAPATIAIDMQDSSTYGDNVQIGVSVTSIISTPTGTVSLYDGATLLGTQTLDSANTTFHILGLTAGSHDITAVYSGDSNFTNGQNDQGLHVSKADSGITVRSPGTITYGDQAELSASVNGPGDLPTGTVTFYEGERFLGTSTITDGEADLGVTGLQGGGHDITAVYNGDDNNNASTSDAYTQTVLAADVNVDSFTSTNTDATYGDSLTFTVTLSSDGGSPTGSVTFHDGDSTLGTVDVDNGVASFTTGTLAVGSHDIYAVYNANRNFNHTQADTITQSIAKATPTVSLSSTGDSTYGDSVTLTVAVSFTTGTPSGTVTFHYGDQEIGTADLVDGVATLTRSNLPAGTDAIGATFDGDGTFNSHESDLFNQNVSQIATSTTVTSAGSTSYGQVATFTATVTDTAGIPTGSVTFYDGDTALGTVTLNDAGSASLSRMNLTAGSHNVTAVYSGDDNSLGSTADDITQAVSKAASSITLTSSSSSPAQNASVTFTATVTSGLSASAVQGGDPVLLSPTGTVTFMDGTTNLATVDLVNGVATYVTTGLALGGHSVTAIYNGAANFNTHSSSAATVTVMDVTPPTASATLTNVQSVNANKYIFTVSFADDTAVDVSTLINKSNVYVTGPKGFVQVARFLAISGGANGSPRVATYQIIPPGGSWDAADAGTYTVHIMGGQVKDTLGNTMTTTTAGSFYMSPTPFFDERYYLAHNAGVAAAVASGAISSGYQHFIQFGQFEGRDPSAFYSEKRYLAYNPDVAKQVKAGLYKSGFDQLMKVGLKQKRQVNPFFNETYYIAANPDVAAQVKAGVYLSGLQQYLLVGQFQGRNPSVNFMDSYYRTQNPSVVTLVQSGAYESAFEHFLEAGQEAGLSANTFFNEQFYLTNYPGVAAAVAAHQFNSGFEHYLLFGQAAGYLPNASAKPKPKKH